VAVVEEGEDPQTEMEEETDQDPMTETEETIEEAEQEEIDQVKAPHLQEEVLEEEEVQAAADLQGERVTVPEEMATLMREVEVNKLERAYKKIN
jgi:hypothetical protein